jgi:hypothetical protein
VTGRAEALNGKKAALRLAHEQCHRRIGRIISSTLDIEEVYERFAEEVQS